MAMMRVFLTGGGGFIGRRVAERLRARGDDVAALVRSPNGAARLAVMGCEIIRGDLSDGVGFNLGMKDADAVIHGAARYEIGISRIECPKMQDVNTGGTRRILDAAIEAKIPKIVHVSTVNVLGNTLGRSVDESHERLMAGDFLSCYDESKYRAHEIALSRAANGAPIVIAMPGVVYGPEDHSIIGQQILKSAKGELWARMLSDVGLSLAYVDDVADGIIAALDRGRIGESYLLAGENTTLDDAIDRAARLAGRTPQQRRITTSTLRQLAKVSKWIMPLFGYPENLSEAIRAASGVTYWATSAKAETELGYRYRDLDQGLRDWFATQKLVN